MSQAEVLRLAAVIREIDDTDQLCELYTDRAAFRWMRSSLSFAVAVQGSQTIAVYSRIGATYVLNVKSVTSYEGPFLRNDL